MGLNPDNDRGAWHATPADKNEKACIDYCQKDDTRAPETTWTLLGTAKEQGKRNDLVYACSLIKEGGIKRVQQEVPHTYVRYHAGFEKLELAINNKPRNRNNPISVLVLWGPTGVGKTKLAWEVAEATGLEIYNKNCSHKWWPGYLNQKVVIMDEYLSQIKLDELLKILDRYPLDIENKGGNRELEATFFIITSNYDPINWYEFHTVEST